MITVTKMRVANPQCNFTVSKRRLQLLRSLFYRITGVCLVLELKELDSDK